MRQLLVTNWLVKGFVLVPQTENPFDDGVLQIF